MLYFLTIKQIEQVIEQYSLRKNEFTIVKDISERDRVWIKHKSIDGYYIIIKPHNERKEYFIVEHTTSKGYVAYIDLWSCKKKEIAFISRAIGSDKESISGQTIDMIEMQQDIITEQNEEIEILKKAGRALQQELKEKEEVYRNNNKQYKKLGRKPKFTKEQVVEIKQKIADNISIAAIAREYNTTRKTIYAAIEKDT